ncbi:MAG: hypothetical protein HKN78_03385 [Sphingomonadaceae bacterium]|nr:hypothetical protein [Sphingomonadaceae bacterium]
MAAISIPKARPATTKPRQLHALALKTIRGIYFDYELWHDFPSEHERGMLATDAINPSPVLREWVDDTIVTGDHYILFSPDKESR